MSAEKILSAILDDLATRIANRIELRLLPPEKSQQGYEAKTASSTVTRSVLAPEPTAIPASIPALAPVPAEPVKLEQLMLDLVRKIGREKVVAALAERGVKKASELTGDTLTGFRAWAEDELGAK